MATKKEVNYDVHGFEAREHGSGFLVSFHLWVPKEHFSEAYDDMFCLLRAAMLGENDIPKAVSRETRKDSDAGGDTEAAEEPAAEAGADGESRAGRGGRRRGRGGDNTADKPPAGESGSGGSRRRRRRGAAEAGGDAAESVADNPSDGAAPAEGGRKRRRRAQAAEAPSTQPEPSKEGGRRTRRSKGTADTGSKKSTVSDEDLTKAASEAAAALGSTDAVMEVLEEFGVGLLNELAGEQRAEFITRLQAEVDRSE